MTAPAGQGKRGLTPMRSAAILLFLLAVGQAGAGIALLAQGVRVLPEMLPGRTPDTGILGTVYLASAGGAVFAGALLWRRIRVGLWVGAGAAIAHVVVAAATSTALLGDPLRFGTARSMVIAACIGFFLWMGRKERRPPWP